MADARKPGKSAGTPPILSLLKKPAAQRTPGAAGAATNECAMAGPTQWSAATGTPVTDVLAAAVVILRATGKRPNRLVVRADALTALCHNPEVCSYAAGTGPGPANLQLLRVVLNVAEIEVKEGGSNTALLVWAPRRQGKGGAAAQHTFKFTNVVAEGAGAEGSVPKPRLLASDVPRSVNNASAADQEYVLDGGKLRVAVRGYSNVEWLRLLPRAEPLVSAIAALLGAGLTPTYEDMLNTVGPHIDAMAPLVAQAAGLAPTVFDSLQPDDGELLLMGWWAANGPFFVKRAMNRIAVRRAEAA